MAKKQKTVYCVSYYGVTGQQEYTEVEATGITMVDSIEDSLLCYNSHKGTVLAIPFSRLILSRLETRQPTAAKVMPLKVAT
jgi:hypothetical protein